MATTSYDVLGRARGELHRGGEAAVEGGDRVDQVVLAHPPGASVALPRELVDGALDVAGGEGEEGALLELAAWLRLGGGEVVARQVVEHATDEAVGEVGAQRPG